MKDMNLFDPKHKKMVKLVFSIISIIVIIGMIVLYGGFVFLGGGGGF
jgi:L-asparagine transporter-like permease